MKKIFFAIVLFATLSVKSQIKYGVQIHGLLNKSLFEAEGMDSSDSKWKLGCGIGGFVEIPLKNNFNLRPSINYQQKGVKANQEFYDEGVTAFRKAEIKLEYIEMPILLVYNFGKQSSKWYVGIGPSFGYGVSGKAETTLNIDGTSETVYYKPFEGVEGGGLGFKQFDLSLNALVGLQIFEKGLIQLGYLHGLSNIENTDEFNEGKFKNRSIMLSLGYYIN